MLLAYFLPVCRLIFQQTRFSCHRTLNSHLCARAQKCRLMKWQRDWLKKSKFLSFWRRNSLNVTHGNIYSKNSYFCYQHSWLERAVVNAERIFFLLPFKHYMNNLYINSIKKQMAMFKNKDDLLLWLPCFISRFCILFPNLHSDHCVLKQ